MDTHGEYKTKQKELVIGCLKELKGNHITAAELSRRLARDNSEIGTATLYRCLNRLVEEGEVRRFVVDSGKSACFQLVDECCGEHYHLVCKKCGRLIHLECDEITRLAEHIKKEHGFVLDAAGTVFSGVCAECQEK